MNIDLLHKAIKIRAFEETLFSLFERGLIRGTIHTCIGQELTGLAICQHLHKDDVIFSNHRCHGHYLALTNDTKGLLCEILGKSTGICKGGGGSQHIYSQHFYTNGIQGGLVPVAAGVAKAMQYVDSDAITLVFIGDGTLGQGVIYETFNLASLWSLPLLFVLENNHYAQSTAIEKNLAGSISMRAQGFGVSYQHVDYCDVDMLLDGASNAVKYVRKKRAPLLLHIETDRLVPHSKGDDCRPQEIIDQLLRKDPLSVYQENNPQKYAKISTEVKSNLNKLALNALNAPPPQMESFFNSEIKPKVERTASDHFDFADGNKKYIKAINKALDKIMDNYRNVIILGEDVVDPYGGAFKATQGLSIKYPDRVLATPISESAITGIGNGLALHNMIPIVEIMFGDFLSLTFDQILNHASKFCDMYGNAMNLPLIIRTPMGGHRGYGATHSQSIEKHFIGIPNISIFAFNTLTDPYEIISEAVTGHGPSLIIESKTDYTRTCGHKKEGIFTNYRIKNEYDGKIVTLRPIKSQPDLSIITYGEALHSVMDASQELFFKHDLLTEIIVLIKIFPIPIDIISEQINTNIVFTAEPAAVEGGFGSELIASICERSHTLKVKRIGARSCSIPTAKELESSVLLSHEQIVKQVLEVTNEYKTSGGPEK